MERRIKRRTRTKKDYSLLLALLLVLVLIPAKKVWAYSDGDLCPNEDCTGHLYFGQDESWKHGYYCDVCGDPFDREPCRGGDINTPCGQQYICEICHQPYGYYLPHRWGDYVSNNDATCNHYETATRTCTFCGETNTKVIGEKSPNKHAGGTEIRDAAAATCSTEGYTGNTYCKGCGVKLESGAAVNALGHDLIHHDAQAATCTEIGWDEYDTCSRCNYTTYKEIAALGHDLVHHDAQAASCTEISWAEYDTCSRCAYTTYKEIGALGHDWGEWQVTTKPEIGKAGERQRICKRCNEKENKPIAALIGYSVTGGGNASWTKGSSGSITITIKRSEDDASCFSHYVETLIDGSPVTVSAKAGSTVVTIGADTLEKLSTGTHTATVKFDDGQAVTSLTIKAAAAPTDLTSPQTGDNSHMGLWISLLCLSGAALAALIITGRKRKAKG